LWLPQLSSASKVSPAIFGLFFFGSLFSSQTQFRHIPFPLPPKLQLGFSSLGRPPPYPLPFFIFPVFFLFPLPSRVPPLLPSRVNNLTIVVFPDFSSPHHSRPPSVTRPTLTSLLALATRNPQFSQVPLPSLPSGVSPSCCPLYFPGGATSRDPPFPFATSAACFRHLVAKPFFFTFHPFPPRHISPV